MTLTNRDLFRHDARYLADVHNIPRCRAHDDAYCEVCGPVCRHGLPLVKMASCPGCLARAQEFKAGYVKYRMGIAEQYEAGKQNPTPEETPPKPECVYQPNRITS